MKKKYSLRKRILYVFMFVAILSSVTLGVFSYMNIANSLRQSSERNANNTLSQVDNNINILLDSYEDVLYQIYTSDDVIKYVDDINNGVNSSVAKNNLRRTLSALVNSKDYIRSISIITSSREIVAYDQMTNKTYENGWMVNYSLTADELYKEISQNALLHIFPPEYGTTFAYEQYYLLHLGHRFVDYRDIRKDVGVVVLSIDEKLIQDCCLSTDEAGDYIFLVDNQGRILSCGANQEYIGKNIDELVDSDGKNSSIELFLSNELSMENFQTFYKQDEALGWNIVYAKDKTQLLDALHTQLMLIIVVEALVFIVITVIIFSMTDRLANSIDKVVGGMQSARVLKENALVEIDDSMPLEIETIASGFNEMIERLEEANESERNALIKQRESQIAALEAQINPHFLYNTLDTINWMAIDRDEYEISNAISALAAILRYAISDSSANVTISEEMDWLKQYIYLQQVRLKNKFVCEIDVAPETQELKIHKLLLQPFVENSIVHGFEENQENCILNIKVLLEDAIIITISDNGKGMPADIVEKCNSMKILEESERKHIGMANAITRLHMYYGEAGTVKVESSLGQGSKVTITIPKEI